MLCRRLGRTNTSLFVTKKFNKHGCETVTGRKTKSQEFPSGCLFTRHPLSPITYKNAFLAGASNKRAELCLHWYFLISTEGCSACKCGRHDIPAFVYSFMETFTRGACHGQTTWLPYHLQSNKSG